MFFKNFISEESGGVVTIDWLVILGGLTASAVMIVEVSTDGLTDHSRDIRGELQDPHFDTSWLDGMNGADGQIASYTSSTDQGYPSGGGNGNNGHGNDDDGNDDSNPGASNDPDDHTDDETSRDSGGTTTTASLNNAGGGPNGNNGHGNDEDGNDDSNPGASNAADDHDDQDGAAGGLEKHEDGDGDGNYWLEGEAPDEVAEQNAAGPVVPDENVQGCPSNDYIAEPIAMSGEELSDDGIEIEGMSIGGATTNVRQCDGVPGRNRFFYANPTMTLDLSDLDGFEEFTVELEGSKCGIGLLLQDATGAFHFERKGRWGSIEMELERMDDLEGRVNLWVGTGRNQTCDAELEIEISD